MSNIKVYVQWERLAVFAGEDVKCTITFKNDAGSSDRSRSNSPIAQGREHGSDRDRWRPEPYSQSPLNANTTRRPTLTQKDYLRAQLGHRPTLSLNSSLGGPHAPVSRLPTPKDLKKISAVDQKHKRSVSIVSISGIPETKEENSRVIHESPSSYQPTQSLRRNGRATSLHHVPTKATSPGKSPQFAQNKTNGTPISSGNSRQGTPNLSGASTFSGGSSSPKATTPVEDVPPINFHHQPGAKASRFPLNFKFPPEEADPATTTSGTQGTGTNQIALGVNAHEPTNGSRTVAATNRALSPTTDGTPRTSGEFYTASNNSTETLASEYVAPTVTRQPYRPLHSRQVSHLAPIGSRSRPPETLMMGYVQLMGSFTLDGSLVNTAPFEEVKRKGVIGGQGGGGVVGVELYKKDNGIFGAFGWNSIGESLGGLLGASEPSSLREMKGVASSRSVPILSTPQSILFVDLRLGPGESKSFSYTHYLPRGIPPTHKGRAMKINYNLVIGTQRAQSNTKQHLMRHADIPFRVLPSVSSEGEILGHDLMLPHILLQDAAHTTSLNDGSDTLKRKPEDTSKSIGNGVPEEFSSYVEHLLNKPRQDSTHGLLSPTESGPMNQLDGTDDTVPIKDIIDYAILRGNSMTSSAISANRFQIQRGGERVATIYLTRPSYRLGETIPVVVDFSVAEVSCHMVHMSLETSESVDPAIALRSSTSVHRATRRVHAVGSEYTICADRAVFSPTIPINATPEFITSGVSLEWKLRFEFVTGLNIGEEEGIEGLMEVVTEDDRGRTLAALEGLPCEGFDVAIPIRVYGAVGGAQDQRVGGVSI